MEDKLTVEEQYRLYLKGINLTEERIHPVQRKQLRQAFFGAFGQCLILMREGIAKLPTEEGVAILDAQMKEVITFFQSQAVTVKPMPIPKPKAEC
jgi:hypothetical protein